MTWWGQGEALLTLAASILLGGIYAVGRSKSGSVVNGANFGRAFAFAVGLLAIVLAGIWPLQNLGRHLFSVQELQILLFRIAGPALVAISTPQDTLERGLQTMGFVPPRSTAFGYLKAGVIRPAAVTVLYIGTFFLWQLPPIHNYAILNGGALFGMHASLLATGLLFWWVVLDRQPHPDRTGYGKRLMMIWIVMLSQIAVGAYTTLKVRILYSAYGETERLASIRPITDEMVGGFIIWIISSLLCLVFVVSVVHMWGSHETKVEEARPEWSSSNSAALLYPATGEALVELARPKNRILALGFVIFAASVFLAVFVVGLLDQYL